MTPTPEMIEAAANVFSIEAFGQSYSGADELTKEEFKATSSKILKAAFAAMWRPIGKALRDGTRYFVHCGEYCTIAWWDADMNDGNGAWTDGCVASWGFQETREVFPVWFIPLSLFEGSWK